MPVRVVSKQADSAVSVPEVECSRLVLAFSVRPLDLEYDVAGRDDVRDVAVREWLFGLETPLFAALRDELRELFEPGPI